VAGAAGVWVAYETAVNASAGPAHVSVLVRVLIVGTLVIGGMYARTSRIQERMGALLVWAGLFSAVWLMNGSSSRLPFSVGMFAAGAFPAVFCYLMLAHPSGHLGSNAERRFLLTVGGGIVVLWTFLVLTSVQPPISGALVKCVPGCPANVLHSASPGDDAVALLKAMTWVLCTVLIVGTALLLYRRGRSRTEPVRRSSVPVAWAAIANAAVWIGFALTKAIGSPLAGAFGAAYVEMAIIIPLAILAGLGVERLFMGQALADFVTGLAQMPKADPQALMAVALRDPTLQIGYWRPGRDICVDVSGAPIATSDLGPGRAISWVQRGHRPVAAVIYDADIAGQDRFVQAAGAAALMRLERAQLEVDLKASTADLAASRIRLVESADAERQRIERDLHDSVQQDLVAVRIKLDMVAEAFREEPSRGEIMLASVGRQMDDVLEALRSLARGIYPSLLSERGLAEALKSVARRSPLPVAVDARGVGRYPEDVEVAVYFCCLEALQNAVKYAGHFATVTIQVRDETGALEFQVRDNGGGFDLDEVADRHGLLNMRDRIEAVGGTLMLSSQKRRGTVVRGRVPLSASHHDGPTR
jgi:signal transduction histidine kinase